DRMLCECLTGYLRGRGIVHRQHPVLDPSADGVVAHAEQVGGLGDLVAGGHGGTLSPHLRINLGIFSATADASRIRARTTLWVCRSHRWSNPLTRSAAESDCEPPGTSGWWGSVRKGNGASPPRAWE